MSPSPTQHFMRISASVATLLLASTAARAQVAISWITVADAGNAADPLNSVAIPGIGSVGYEYRIGATEVTNAQYTAFLNAVAASDPNGLYNLNMGIQVPGGISRSGSDGSYTYSVKANMGNKPVNYVSWYDAARFCNWMTNGQGSGGTESGTYTFTGVSSISGITRNLLNPNQVFIPTENEWYKAAYFQPASQGGDADGYWLYATQSNSVPTVASATSIGDVANPGANVANYVNGADWNGQDGNVTTVSSAGSTSYFGAFDMNGNVWELNETQLDASGSRGLRGGSYLFGNESNLRSSSRFGNAPTNEGPREGFRVASPVPTPEPCLADTNGDGEATAADFSAWIAAFNASAPECDQNGDGLCTAADFSAWIANFNAGC